MHARKTLKAGLLFSLALSLAALTGSASAEGKRPVTYMNPLDLPYRFALADNPFANGKSAREAADPMVVEHNGEFWLFASKCGGYWHSKDLVHWTFITPTGFPTEDYAPTVKVIGDKWVLVTSAGGALYTSDDPAAGVWTKVRAMDAVNDPDLFVDEDGRVYLYSGSSPDQPIYGQELDPKADFAAIGEKVLLIKGLDPIRHGWEGNRPLGTDQEIAQQTYRPWMEGSTMTRYAGKYYLQYAAPGTEMKEYADGVYVADHPLGPYHYAAYSPISAKPTGFVTSAGHSVTFEDNDHRYWRVVSMLVGVNYMFERRLGLFPAGFLGSGKEEPQFVTNTYLGDYPQLAPGETKTPLTDNLAGWMLLSYKKAASASSVHEGGYAPDKAFDEDIQTWWAAASDKPGEWLSVDFGKPSRIEAVQINFADAFSTAHGRLNDAYQYTIDVSDDGKTWRQLIDRSQNNRDAPHDYIQLDAPVTARYARITNVHTPAGAVFSISGLRFFGSGLGKAPKAAQKISGKREANRRLMTVAWAHDPAADFHIVRYGIKPDRLTLNYQVYAGDSVTIPGLNTDSEYYFAVDAVNDTAVTRGSKANHAQ